MQGFLHAHGVADIALLLFAALAMPAFAAWSAVRLKKAPPQSLIPRYAQTIVRGWVVALIVLAVWMFSRRPFAGLGLDWPIGIWGKTGLALDAAAAAFLLVQFVRLPKLVRSEDFPKYDRMIRALKIMPRTRPELMLFFAVAVTAGVWEELLYRGFLLWFFSPDLGVIGAVLVSSFLFGLGHIYQGWRGVPRTALIGLVFAAAYVLTKSLWWLMLAHALLDVYGGALGYRLTVLAKTAGATSLSGDA